MFFTIFEYRVWWGARPSYLSKLPCRQVVYLSLGDHPRPHHPIPKYGEKKNINTT